MIRLASWILLWSLAIWHFGYAEGQAPTYKEAWFIGLANSDEAIFVHEVKRSSEHDGEAVATTITKNGRTYSSDFRYQTSRIAVTANCTDRTATPLLEVYFAADDKTLMVPLSGTIKVPTYSPEGAAQKIWFYICEPDRLSGVIKVPDGISTKDFTRLVVFPDFSKDACESARAIGRTMGRSKFETDQAFRVCRSSRP